MANNREIFTIIAQQNKFDQLKWEKGGAWVHVSYRADGNNRRQMLNYNGATYANINNKWKTIINA